MGAPRAQSIIFVFIFLQIIEKRRRDRINNCLVELRRLVPAAFEKQVRKVIVVLRVDEHWC